jgi:nitroimidazol reductase NimA-like FMN-containing flavoprotein (pyridoxamine 5'-phosphate oxidase superfamily)
MGSDPTVYEEIDQAACEALLEKNHFGRIAVVSGGAPDVFPVNYVFHDGRVAIRTDPGTKLDAAALGRVAFEIDDVDEAARTGWSVVVKGTGYDVTESMDDVSEEIRRYFVDTWVPGVRTRWIRIEPTSITGRRLRPA